jgi:hypothetical protein
MVRTRAMRMPRLDAELAHFVDQRRARQAETRRRTLLPADAVAW